MSGVVHTCVKLQTGGSYIIVAQTFKVYKYKNVEKYKKHVCFMVLQKYNEVMCHVSNVIPLCKVLV